MSEDDLKPSPPPGIYTNYHEIHSFGTFGPIDSSVAQSILDSELNIRVSGSQEAVARSRDEIRNMKAYDSFIKSYISFRLVSQTYPVTKQNQGSGERIPIVHSEEIANTSVVLAYQGHYKAAYQSLREVLELVALQLHFYTLDEKSKIVKWGRGEIKTPGLRQMLKKLKYNDLFRQADKELRIVKATQEIYENLGAYIHTRGLPTTSMGLTGTNIIQFAPEAFERFLTLFSDAIYCATVLLVIFFPAAIFKIPAFRKFGHLDPSWIPREDEVDFIRSFLSSKDLTILENCADRNARFRKLQDVVLSLPDLSDEEIDESYSELKSSSHPAEMLHKLFMKHEILEPFAS